MDLGAFVLFVCGIFILLATLFLNHKTKFGEAEVFVSPSTFLLHTTTSIYWTNSLNELSATLEGANQSTSFESK